MKNINFNKTRLKNLSKLPISLHCLMLTALAISLILVNYCLILHPDFEKNKKLVNQENSLKMDYENKLKITNNDNEEVQGLMLKNHYESKIETISKKDEIHQLLVDIQEACVKSGITLEVFSPEPELKHPFLTEESIHMIVIGKYHQLALFLNQLLHFNRLIRFDYFDITKISFNGSQNNFQQLRMEVEAKIYQYKHEIKR
ncbi:MULTISPECIES: type 4a pilus biogenesis protein PilO [Legionella]|uniref:Tfp pilus assembly protein PilO n=1 Tax=Legionella maceachernii TaxID=466 RepID=A0A0W0W178_9GAMM|nr:type 4a pilus biogenesis protein PilO [Legionella maceachernii]KTD26003.1 Tfp pilus assembly protein PilO [Legionella maceachernii]SJZ50384.1 type IV pilus assembly protein PilO [Legionella maceachernii]SUP03751.1 Pilus assembly protein, PilO [Legionella maceachernii]